ncbi:MAG: radical SAM protein [bacterium]|nr:radical SAM protein [bacterium]
MIQKKVKKGFSLFSDVYHYNFGRYFHPLSPTQLQINITYRCNSRCQACQIWQMKPKKEMNLREWEKVMKDPIFGGIRYLLLAGGEPVLHPELLELVKIFISAMPKLQSLNLVTNGLLAKRTVAVVKDLALLSERKRINFSVSVSLDGLGNTNDSLRGIPGAFLKTKNTILGLAKIQKKYSFGLGVSGVVSRKNLIEITEVDNWCKTIKIPFNFQIIGFHKTYVQNLKNQNDLDFRPPDREVLLKLIGKLADKKNKKDLRSYLRTYYWEDMSRLYQGGKRSTPCPFVLDAFAIGSLGDVYYCLSEDSIGNVRQGKSASQIYFDAENLEKRKEMAKSVCLKCNSGCMVTSAIAKDFRKFLFYLLTGKLGPSGVY